MNNANEVFLEELQQRLEENRQLAEKTLLPRFLRRPASYLAFHHFRTVLIISLLVTVAMFWLAYQPLLRISKTIFLYG